MKSKSKTEIVKLVADKLGIGKKGADDILEAIASEIHTILVEDGIVKIPHLGVMLRTVEKPALPARQVRSPKTGEMIDAPAKDASTIIRAKVTKELKNLIS